MPAQLIGWIEGKHAEGQEVNFANYGKSFNQGTDTFKGEKSDVLSDLPYLMAVKKLQVPVVLLVEAKKADPRDDQHILNRNSSSIHGSPGPARTKKIFVGGLASTVTESDLKKYFDKFGTITDVVVMYDHNTQRPRGFGFITYDSEDAVEKVIFKTFHEPEW
ncbi:hypothetical protein IFM89_024377 [Coptis chinensis]|uniref:RRM domain-containing protein n=1 Tax=Coptis chinensis TaxID=261450 RepID=A0A835IY97_9MAGN|nr:hypothetical protein IFM89_024377 [Coptis chinensis]